MTATTPAQIDLVYRARKDRLACAPEGKYDRQRRWYPSSRKTGSGLSVRAPSAAYPYSYIKACCTKKHVQDLAEVCLKYFAELVTEALPNIQVIYASKPEKIRTLLAENPQLAGQDLAGTILRLRGA